MCFECLLFVVPVFQEVKFNRIESWLDFRLRRVPCTRNGYLGQRSRFCNNALNWNIRRAGSQALLSALGLLVTHTTGNQVRNNRIQFRRNRVLVVIVGEFVPGTAEFCSSQSMRADAERFAGIAVAGDLSVFCTQRRQDVACAGRKNLRRGRYFP